MTSYVRFVAICLLAAFLIAFLTGCGSSNHSATVGPTPTPGGPVTFESRRALDPLSDAANTNNTFNVWVMNSDGSGPTPLTKLTASSADSRGPIWSPDGRKIAFRSSRVLDPLSNAANTNFTTNIWAMNADGTGATPLTKLTASGAGSRGPIWSPDGSKIVFISSRALDPLSDAANNFFTFNIWVMNADGTGAKPLTKLTAAGADSDTPIWSPDGSKIVFASSRALDPLSDAANTNNTFNIWVMNADGSGATALTKLTASGADSSVPIWSPDGSKIVFASSRALDPVSGAANTNFTDNIWVMNADGTGAKPLTKVTANGAGSSEPVWSPDGSKIGFQSSRALDPLSDAANANLTFNIWDMNADGSGATALTKLTANGAGSHNPIWSRDGSKIFFASTRALDGTDAVNTNNTQNIWVINADGTGATPMTKLTVFNAGSDHPRQ